MTISVHDPPSHHGREFDIVVIKAHNGLICRIRDTRSAAA